MNVIRRAGSDLLAVLSLVLLTLVFFGRVLFTDQALIWGDILVAFYPASDLWRQGILQRQLPLWNPYIFTGMPFLADAQYSSLYPSMLLNLFLPLHRALAVDLALHVFLLAVFTYVFLRRQSLAPAGALLGAMIFAFSGFVAVRIHHVSLIRTLAWLPLLLYAIAGFSPRRKILGSSLFVGLVLAVMVLAGHLQTVLISGLLATVYGLWRVFSMHRTEGRAAGSPLLALIAVLGLGAVTALLLAAAQIVPAVELVRHSERSDGTDYNFATSFSLPARQLPMLASPRLFGTPTQEVYWGEWLYWEMVGYSGIVSLLLALMGVLFSRRRDRFFWLAVVLLGVGLALGRDSPLYRLAYWVVPGISYFRVPARFLVWYSLGVAVLAAFGLESLQRDPARSRRWAGFVTFTAGVGLLALYWAGGGSGAVFIARWLADGAVNSATFFPPSLRSTALAAVQGVTVSEGRRFALLWLGAGLLVVASRWPRVSRRLVVWLLCLMTVFDLFSFGMNFYPTTRAADIYGKTATAGLMDLSSGAYRLLTTPRFASSAWSGVMAFTSGIRDSEDLMRFRSTLVPNMNVQQRLLNVTGYGPIVVVRPQQVIGLALRQAERNGGRSALLDFLGTRYIFTRADLSPTLRGVYQGPFYMWRNDAALPRGFLVTRFVVEPEEERVGRLLGEGLDPRKVVILDRAPRSTYGLRDVEIPGQVLGRSYALSRLSFGLALDRPAIFVLSDAYYPGWRAYADGVSQPVYRANHAFRAVVLPAGVRRLEFVYEPRSVRLGLGISGVAWSLVALLWIRHRNRRSVFPRRDEIMRPNHADI